MSGRANLFIVMSIVVVFVVGGAVEHFRPHHNAWAEWQRRYVIARTDILRVSTAPADVVMLGDSLTEYQPDWAGLLDERAVNMGIGGDTADHALTRLDAVIAHKPKVVAIMLGINDVLSGRKAPEIAAEIERIAEKLSIAGTVPIIESTLLTAPSHRTPAATVEVRALNQMLAAWSAAHRIDFLDLNAALSDPNGLREEFTWDGLHLKGEGYRLWSNALRGAIGEYLAGK